MTALGQLRRNWNVRNKVCSATKQTSLDQLQPLQAGMAFFTDNDVIMYRDAQWLGHLDNDTRHLNVGTRRCRVASGMIVHQDDSRRSASRVGCS